MVIGDLKMSDKVRRNNAHKQNPILGNVLHKVGHLGELHRNTDFMKATVKIWPKSANNTLYQQFKACSGAQAAARERG